MSLWFLVWFALSFVLLGTTFWSTIILIQQKQAWKKYAEQKGLSFTPGKFFEPAQMEGVLNGYNLSFFTAVQQKEDARKNRQLTVFQINLHELFIDGIGLGTAEMLPFLQSLESISSHDMKSNKWNKKHHIMTRNKKAVEAYLTDERVGILSGILDMPKADVLILLDDKEGVFRIETSNPLQDADQIDKLVTKMFSRIGKLRPSEEEAKKLAGLIDKSAEKPAAAPEPEIKEQEAPKEG